MTPDANPLFRSPALFAVFGFALLAGSLCLGQDKKRDGPLSAEEVGRRIVAAIKDGDVKPLEMFVAATGVQLGPQEPPLSAQAFITQLEQKRGYYCVLMDTSCLIGAREGAPDTSLRGRMLRQPATVKFLPQADFPEIVELKVVPQARQDVVLFSVFVRRTHEGWRLVRIQYT